VVKYEYAIKFLQRGGEWKLCSYRYQTRETAQFYAPTISRVLGAETKVVRRRLRRRHRSTTTITIQIGNTDNKLSQSMWAHFCEAMKHAVRKHAQAVHFQGGSDWDAPWQNACWVAEVSVHHTAALEKELNTIRKAFQQDSAAITYGQTKFI
jgi:hypothetical protein